MRRLERYPRLRNGANVFPWQAFPVNCMRLAPRLFCILLASVLFSGCQSRSSYKITLKDGREYLCNGQPEFQRKTGYYRYRTIQDRDAMLRADEVLLIEEQGT